MANLLIQPGTFEERAIEALEVLISVVQADWATLRLPDPDAGGLRLVAVAGRGWQDLPPAPLRPFNEDFITKTFNSGEMDLANDYPSHPDSNDLAIKRGIKSTVGLPIESRGHIIGVISVDSRHTNHFTEERVKKLSTAAYVIGSLLENARLQEQEQLRSQRLEALHTIAVTLSGPGTFTERAGRVLVTLSALVGAEQAVLRLPDPSGEGLKIEAATGVEAYDVELLLLIPFDSMPGVAFNSGETIIINDYSSHPQADPQFAGAGVNSFIAIPVMAGGHVLGVISLNSKRLNQFDEGRIGLLSSVVLSIGSQLYNAKLIDSERLRTLELDTQFKIARILGEHGSFTVKVTKVLDLLSQTADADLATLRVLDDRAKGLRLVATIGETQESTPSAVLRYDEGMAGLAFLSGRPEIVDHYPSHSKALPRVIKWGVMSAAVLPVKASSGVLGTVNLHSKEPNHFTPELVRHITAISDNIGTLLENAQLQELETLRTKELETQFKIATVLSGKESLRDKATKILLALIEVVQANFASLRINNEETQTLGLIASVGDPIHPPAQSLGYDQGIVGLSWISGEPAVINDYPSHPQAFPSVVESGIQSMIVFPINSDGRSFGTLNIDSFATDHFTPQRIAYVTAVADSLGPLLENARLRDEDRIRALQLEFANKELKETQLQVVRQERLNALGQMASGIAHDFNNSLTPILGFSELLLTNPQHLENPDTVKRYVQMINTAAGDAATVVSNMREFYRESDEEQEFKPVSLNHTAAQVVSLTQAKWKDEAQSKGISIDLETDLAVIPKVSGNESAIREVLTNLVFNSVDAMPDGGTIRFCTRLDDNHVAIQISDTGSGMTEEVRQRCFEPFFTTKGSLGTGLGLAMTFGIVKRLNGTIDIQSELGKGTTFTIRFPVYIEEAKKETEAALVMETKTQLRVLVIDDEPMVRELITEYLTADGHVVESATNGRKGLETFHAGVFDLVITDRAMPEMNGDDLARAIKMETPGIPIVMLTGFGDIINANGSLSPNVNRMVSKPVSCLKLQKIVNELSQ